MVSEIHYDIRLELTLSIYIYIGAGNGNPLQCFCLGNPVGRGAWWAAVPGVAVLCMRTEYVDSPFQKKDFEACK